MEALIKFVQDEFVTKKDFPEFGAGDTITVYYEIREGEKTRTQFFRGVVIQVKGTGITKTFTIRKMSGTVGVERIFPLNMPALQKIEINKKGSVRRARIYYFRGLTGKKPVSKKNVCSLYFVENYEKPCFYRAFFMNNCSQRLFVNCGFLKTYKVLHI